MKYLLGLLMLLCSQVQALSLTSTSPGGAPVTMQTCPWAAHSICSVTLGGTEMVNRYDHGRLLQSAASFNGLGENYNPTAAGASSLTDGFEGHASSSVVLTATQTPSALYTKVKMAYWFPVNGQPLSNYVLDSTVVVNPFYLPGVFQHTTAVSIPVDEYPSQGQFEILTGYMPPSFSSFWALDMATGNIQTLTDGPGEQNSPVIFSTPDQSKAMGIFTAETVDGYGRWRFSNCNIGDTVKWNVVARRANPRGTVNFVVYTAVGTLQEVRDSILNINRALKRRY